MNVIPLSPHVGSATYDAPRRQSQTAAQHANSNAPTFAVPSEAVMEGAFRVSEKQLDKNHAGTSAQNFHILLNAQQDSLFSELASTTAESPHATAALAYTAAENTATFARPQTSILATL